MRILVYSPVRLFGDCLASFLLTQDAVSTVQTEFSILDIDQKAMAFQADIVLIDVTAKAAMVVARLVKVLSPDVATVAVAVNDDPQHIVTCAKSGFDSYVPLVASPAQMMDIIQRARKGETVCDARMARALFNELARLPPSNLPSATERRLTPREIDIARMLGRGAANKEIAGELHLSVATIKNHVHSVLNKLHLTHRSQVAELLTENPLVLRTPNVGPTDGRGPASASGTV